VLAILRDPDRRSAGAVDPRLEDVAVDVAHAAQNRTTVLSRLVRAGADPRRARVPVNPGLTSPGARTMVDA
jgi:hypothetical protein